MRMIDAMPAKVQTAMGSSSDEGSDESKDGCEGFTDRGYGRHSGSDSSDSDEEKGTGEPQEMRAAVTSETGDVVDEENNRGTYPEPPEQNQDEELEQSKVGS